MDTLFTGNMLFLVAVLVLFAFLAAVIAFLVVRERRRDDKLEQFASSAEEFSLHKAERQAEEIVAAARAEARKIAAAAEETSVRSIEWGKEAAQDAEGRYEAALRDVEEQIRKHLAADSARAEETARGMAASFETALSAHLSKTTSGLEKAMAAHEKAVGQTFKALEEEGVQRLTKAIEQGLAATRASITRYESARVAAVDAHVVELVTRTAEIALGKTMPLEEHVRLLYRSLEEARNEGFFAHDTGRDARPV